jgi:hypothetical protein
MKRPYPQSPRIYTYIKPLLHPQLIQVKISLFYTTSRKIISKWGRACSGTSYEKFCQCKYFPYQSFWSILYQMGICPPPLSPGWDSMGFGIKKIPHSRDCGKNGADQWAFPVETASNIGKDFIPFFIYVDRALN